MPLTTQVFYNTVIGKIGTFSKPFASYDFKANAIENRLSLNFEIESGTEKGQMSLPTTIKYRQHSQVKTSCKFLHGISAHYQKR